MIVWRAGGIVPHLGGTGSVATQDEFDGDSAMTRRVLGLGALVAACVTLAAAALPMREPSVKVGADDIGGVVTGPNGPEAGVWVIAETSDLPTKFVRIVVTDDQGRYLIPDLPKANYDVWVRGYGLVDSPKSACAIGSTMNQIGRAHV